MTTQPPILIVDDDPTYRVLMREALERDHFTVLEAADGEEALAMFATASPRPGMVVADVLMPGMDGFALCQELRKRTEAHHVPILMVTALDDVESITRAYEVDATDFITKPFNWMILSHRVRYMLRASRAFGELFDRQQQLKLLEGIAAAANSTTSFIAVLQLAIERICAYLGWSFAHVHFASSTGTLVSGIAYNSGSGFAPPEGSEWTRLIAACAASAAHEVQHQAVPVFHPVDPEITERAAKTFGHALRGVVAIPVTVGNEVTAVVEFFISAARDPGVVLLQLLAQIGNHLGRVAERKDAEDRLIHNASHDALTSLPNRVLLLDRLQRAVTLRRRNPYYHFALMFIDLDRFKIINDSLGHAAGDQLLVEVSQRLASIQRTADLLARPELREGGGVLARLGGDEFTLLLDDIRYASDALRVAGRLHEVLAEPFVLDGTEVHVTASIGIATSETDYASPDEVLRDADLAMYRAKSLGRARSEVFDRTMHAAAVKRLQIEGKLRIALEQRQFDLHYQPMVRLGSGEIDGFEALLRWRQPDGSIVPPAEFIDIAEDMGIIVGIGLWVIEEACATVARWNRELRPNGKPVTIGINLSPRQFSHADLVSEVRRIIGATGIDPRLINFEITEGVAMSDGDRAIRVLSQLRGLGVKISIDDFGTGFSSLSYLHRFPIDILKIDRSFVSRLDDDRSGRDIVKTIVDLGKNLGFEIVAEGAETRAQVSELRALGCDFYQGFAFSQPVSRAEAAALMGEPTTQIAIGAREARAR